MDHATSHPTVDRDSPPPSVRLSVEAEASLMNRGRGRQPLALAVGAVLMLGAGALLLQHISRGEAYSDAAAATARIEQDHFNAFFACALPGARPAQLNAQRVHSAFEKLGDRFGKAYAKTLDGCLPKMQALTVSVRALKVPADVEPEHAALVRAATALATTNRQYLHYLSSGAREYEPAAAMLLLEKFGAGWSDYRVAQTGLEKALQERM